MGLTLYKLPDGWSHEVTGTPTVEPVSLTEFKLHSRVSASAEDVYLNILLPAARLNVENWLKRKLIEQTVKFTFDDFSGGDLELPYPPCSAVTEVGYRDTAGAAKTCTTYTLRLGGPEQCTVLQAPDAGWPSTDGHPKAAYIEATCGYGAAASDVPAGIRMAIMQLASIWYEHREPVQLGQGYELPMHVRHLLHEYRFWY
jgi:uncharacterized phiE125 gp8 family phage protein